MDRIPGQGPGPPCTVPGAQQVLAAPLQLPMPQLVARLPGLRLATPTMTPVAVARTRAAGRRQVQPRAQAEAMLEPGPEAIWTTAMLRGLQVLLVAAAMA